jgi:hypothetical protein
MTQSPTLLLSTAYLAPVSYYAHLFHAPHVIIEAHENYNKQTYQPRLHRFGPRSAGALHPRGEGL